MRLPVVLLSFMLCLGSASAQLLELKAYHELSGINALSKKSEQARKYYDIGDPASCVDLMFQALESEQLGAMDHLILANSLNATGKTALAKEFYKEYLMKLGIDYGPIPDMVEGLFKNDSSEQPIKSILDTLTGLYGIYPHEDKYVSRGPNSLLKTSLNCDKELINRSFGWNDAGIWKNTGICFYDGGYKAIISRLNRTSSLSRLFSTELTKDGWSEPQELKFQEKGKNYAFPSIDEKTNILYFSSDQDGSVGGYDMYLSYMVKNKFELAVNLGNQVNTEGHEIYPRMEKGYLCFSSNGMPGKGGFDFYRFKSIDDYNYLLLNDMKYSSAAEDYDMQVLGNKEYLVNRALSTKGIMLHYSMPIPHVEYRLNVIDAAGKKISNAVVLLGSGEYLETNNNGYVKFEVLGRSNQQQVRILAEGYEETSALLEGYLINEVMMRAIQSVNIVKVVNRSDTSDQQVRYVAAQDSLVKQEPMAADMERGVHLPDKGYYYIIVASARDYASAYKSWSKWVETFEDLEIIKFSEGLYRIGFKSGKTELTAISQLQSTLKIKKDAWIIRPGTL